MTNTNLLAWIDLEMTGLDPEKHHIIEIACLVTNSNLDIIADVTEITQGEINFQEVEDRLGHDRMYWLNCGKLDKELGYYPTMDLEKYLEDTFK